MSETERLFILTKKVGCKDNVYVSMDTTKGKGRDFFSLSARLHRALRYSAMLMRPIIILLTISTLKMRLKEIVENTRGFICIELNW